MAKYVFLNDDEELLLGGLLAIMSSVDAKTIASLSEKIRFQPVREPLEVEADRMTSTYPDRPIQAIKELRLIYHDPKNGQILGLKEAKDAIDAARRRAGLIR